MTTGLISPQKGIELNFSGDKIVQFTHGEVQINTKPQQIIYEHIQKLVQLGKYTPIEKEEFTEMYMKAINSTNENFYNNEYRNGTTKITGRNH